jgi:hypothetical protein
VVQFDSNSEKTIYVQGSQLWRSLIYKTTNLHHVFSHVELHYSLIFLSTCKFDFVMKINRLVTALLPYTRKFNVGSHVCNVNSVSFVILY